MEGIIPLLLSLQNSKTKNKTKAQDIRKFCYKPQQIK